MLSAAACQIRQARASTSWSHVRGAIVPRASFLCGLACHCTATFPRSGWASNITHPVDALLHGLKPYERIPGGFQAVQPARWEHDVA